MTNQVIPAEAVEAAKAGIRAHAHIDWQAEHLVEGLARAALEGAAPYMLPSRNHLMDLIADAYGDKNHGHLSVKAADAILSTYGATK